LFRGTVPAAAGKWARTLRINGLLDNTIMPQSGVDVETSHNTAVRNRDHVMRLTSQDIWSAGQYYHAPVRSRCRDVAYYSS
jgi:hypothetical protein